VRVFAVPFATARTASDGRQLFLQVSDDYSYRRPPGSSLVPRVVVVVV